MQIVYSIGVDPVLMQFQPVVKNSSDQRRKWVKSIHRTTNTHDVRALACIGNKKVIRHFLSITSFIITEASFLTLSLLRDFDS